MDPNDRSPHRSVPAEDGAIGVLVRLCRALEDAASAQQVVHQALPIVRSVLGDRVAFDLRRVGAHRDREAPGTGELVAPLRAGARHFGDLRATGIDADSGVAEAFASAAGHIIGTALLLQAERLERTESAASTTVALSHRLGSSVATIGVASSTLRIRDGALTPDVRHRLLLDIEANVATLRDALDALSAGRDIPGAHDG